MQRRTTLIQQERDALDAYESLIHTMREVAQRESDSVRPLGRTFEAALARLSDATTRIVNIHTALVGAVSDGSAAGAPGAPTGAGFAAAPPAAVDDSALRKLDERRGELIRQATELTELLRARRDHLRGELDKVRVPRKPRSVYGGENSASIIDVSG
jgi:hypothetical protein